MDLALKFHSLLLVTAERMSSVNENCQCFDHRQHSVLTCCGLGSETRLESTGWTFPVKVTTDRHLVCVCVCVRERERVKDNHVSDWRG